MISDPGNKVAVKLLGNFCYLKTHKSFPYAGNVGSHSFGLQLHSWVYKQGWWHLNLLEMNPNPGTTAGSPEESADLSYQGNLSFYGQKACPSRCATSVSDQNQLERKFPLNFHLFLQPENLQWFFILRKMFIALNRRFYLFLKFSRMCGTPNAWRIWNRNFRVLITVGHFFNWNRLRMSQGLQMQY